MTPNYESDSPQASKKKWVPVWGIVLLVGCLLLPITVVVTLAVILISFSAQKHEKGLSIVCLDRSHKIGVATLFYAQDYDDALPPKKGAWIDLLEPYTLGIGVGMTTPTQQPIVYQCPSVTSGAGYAMSTKAAGIKPIMLEEPDTVRVIFDSDAPGRNAFAAPETVSYRHADQRGTIVFADGHAKSLRQ